MCGFLWGWGGGVRVAGGRMWGGPTVGGGRPRQGGYTSQGCTQFNIHPHGCLFTTGLTGLVDGEGPSGLLKGPSVQLQGLVTGALLHVRG